MQQDYQQAAAYINALTGEPAETAGVWFRLIHDTEKGVPAHKYYGTLPQLWEMLCSYNSQGWGVFVNINAFAPDAEKHELPNVWYIRTQAVDLDNLLTAQQNYQLASAWTPSPTFAVNTSPGKYHVYWTVQPYQGNEYYNQIQRKLRQIFDGDEKIIDPTRVLRLPGFYHLKNPNAPHLVTCWTLGGYGQRYGVETLQAALEHVHVIEGGNGERHQLGDPELAAPSLDWLRFALSLLDPNTMDRGNWISTTAAIKQAGWTLTDEQTLHGIWSEWCSRYGDNDLAENDKAWQSIRNSEVGWPAMKRRAPTLIAYERFGFKDKAPQPVPIPVPVPQPDQPPDTPQFGEILSEYDCPIYFKNCYYVVKEGEILTPQGRFVNQSQFNAQYGGKVFVFGPSGKTTNEAWAAATRSVYWTIPKVDHIRFLPDQPKFALIEDQLGRIGVNTYFPIKIKRRPGDVTPWLRHMELMLPVESDRKEIFRFFAHNVKYPGFKIPWAPLVQSTEGVGKSFIQASLERVLGEMYCYTPPAEELVKSSSTFNAWQRGKLLIIVNEIKVDERRELIEILKPQITDLRVQIQAKGQDQEMEDNPANWLFFSNWKDAIPINENGRRYAIFYSAIQSVSDLMARGMDDAYFNRLKRWLDHEAGHEIIADWLLNYPVERGDIPMRAPLTSSVEEAKRVSRGPIDRAILNAVEDGLPGFKGGYVSTLAVLNRLHQIGIRKPALATVERILEQMGYFNLGRAPRAFGQESMQEKTQLFGTVRELPVELFGRVQGYEA